MLECNGDFQSVAQLSCDSLPLARRLVGSQGITERAHRSALFAVVGS